MSTGNVNGQSERVAFRCPVALAERLREAARGGPSLSLVVVHRLERCATLEAENARLKRLCEAAGIPTW